MNFLLSSHYLGTFLGFEVRIAYSLYLIMGFFALPYIGGNYLPLISVLCLPLFVLLHELGHSVAARRVGVRVEGITLYMLGGVAQLGSHIPGPKAELFIAVAGPVVSLFLAGVGFLGAHFLPSEPLAILAVNMFLINLMLGLFNLLPIFPMDGGRIALALAIMKLGVSRGLRLIRPLAMAGAVAVAVYGAYRLVQGDSGGLFVILIGGMLFFHGGQELQGRLYAQEYTAQAADFRPSDGGAGWRSGQAAPHEDRYGPLSRYETEEYQARIAAGKEGVFGRWRRKRAEDKARRADVAHAEMNRRVDAILAKVKAEGIAGLNAEERAILQQASNEYRKR